MFHLNILNQKRIFEDGYDEFYSYDDCILDKVANNSQIKNILKTEESKTISNGIDESMFKSVFIQMENIIKLGECNKPNIKLQTTFTLTSLTDSNFAWIGYSRPFQFDLEFPQSIVVKEVNNTYKCIQS